MADTSADRQLRSQQHVNSRRAGLSNTTVLGYGLGNFAFALLGLVVAVNLQFFYTDYVGLSAGLVAWSLLFARMFDAVSDPVIGWLSDHTNTSFGRRRPWIVAASIPAGLYLVSLVTLFRFQFTADDLAKAQVRIGRG